MGACRRHELHKLELRDVENLKSALVVTIKNKKTKTLRKFTVTGKYYNICKKYMDLRPENCVAPQFFVNYANGKCTVQNVGINKLGNMGKKIATYLNLPNPNLYTGHCFRRSTAILLAVDSEGAKSHKELRVFNSFKNSGSFVSSIFFFIYRVITMNRYH